MNSTENLTLYFVFCSPNYLPMQLVPYNVLAVLAKYVLGCSCGTSASAFVDLIQKTLLSSTLFFAP